MKSKNLLKFTFLVLLVILIFSLAQKVSAQEKESICAVYITGIGCSNCAITDPAILSEFTAKYPELIIIEYEIYQQRENNLAIANQYFSSYLSEVSPGVPFLIFSGEETGLGRVEILEAEKIIEDFISNKSGNNCPLSDGTSISLENLDLTSLPGRTNIWTKGRILMSEGGGGDNEILKKLLTTNEIAAALQEIKFQKTEAVPIKISRGELEFDQAVKLDRWIFQWRGKDLIGVSREVSFSLYWILPFVLAFFLGLIYFFQRKKISPDDIRKKNLFIVGIAILLLIGFFCLSKHIPVESLKQAGGVLPLPLFTFLIAIVDGFNPCNLFVLTLLLGFLIGASHERKRIYIVGYTFVGVVLIFYFVFMVFWLNIFRFIGFITPLRITIAFIALGAGAINCKELFAFRRGITLMIQEKYKGPLVKKVERVKDLIKKGSIPILVSSSITLAAFASLVELPCTAGFPIIYTGILTGKVLESGFLYYFWLLFYSIVYVIPLVVIIGIFGFTFKGKQINQRQMQVIKFIGGAIMIALGIILLVNPALLIPIE